jgi:PTS system cellobiose-specific IIB component
VTATAAPLETLDISLDEADVLLLGSHLEERADSIRSLAATKAVAVAVLPDSVFSSPTGDEALDLALGARGGRS